MELTINLMYAICLTSITGAVLALLWLLAGVYLKSTGHMCAALSLMKAELFFWIVPVVYLILLIFRNFIRRGYSRLFELTPVVLYVSMVFCAIWIIGFATGMVRYVLEIVRLHKWRKCAIPCGVQECRAFTAVCREYGLARDKVELMYLHGISGPQAMGVLHPCVLIPAADYTDEELEVIFRHELIHIKQRDLMFKHMIGLVRTFNFFNPLFWLYQRMLEEWMEIACDSDACSTVSSPLDYFNILLNMAVSEKHQAIMIPLFGSKSQLRKRMEYVCIKRKDFKVYLFAIALAVSVMGTGTAIYAQVVTTCDVCDLVYNNTVVETDETLDYTDEDVLIEYETKGLADGVIETEGEVISSRSGSISTFEWSVESGCSVKSPAFSAKSGQKIFVSVVADPSETSVRVGIIEPTGTRRYVNIASDGSHAFSLSCTGFYRVYVENTTSTDVKVYGTYGVYDE